MARNGRRGAVDELSGRGQARLARRLAGRRSDPSPAPADAVGGLAPEQAARVYNRIGRLQDSQRFYESPAVSDLVERADFGAARSVFELGCGTGAFAARLLDDVLALTATYVGVDVSSKMVALASGRVATFGERASVCQVTGYPPLPGATGAFDRFVSIYVLDLLDEQLARQLIDEARRLLAPDGLLCLVSLTQGTTGASRALCRAWNGAWQRAPRLVGGCRPIDLTRLLDGWQIEYERTVVTWAVPSQVVVARP
jgi:SAM-dependent methyltransferase